MSDEDGYGWKAFPAYNPVHYINAGQVKIRFFHIGTGTYPGMGTVGHYLYIDYLVLQEGGGAGGGVTEHGALTGLADDDHTQYLDTTRHDTKTRHGISVVDHGQIDGLGDDDHSQYLRTDGSRIMTGFLKPVYGTGAINPGGR